MLRRACAGDHARSRSANMRKYLLAAIVAAGLASPAFEKHRLNRIA
jgi:hypothetical protein